MIRLTGVVLLIAAFAAVGCDSGSSSSSNTSADASGDTSAQASATPNCGAAPNLAPVLAPTTVSTPPPTMTGGTIVEGTYIETGYVYYNGETSSSSHKETLILSNGTMKNIGSEGGSPDRILGGTYTTSGNTLTFNITCPQPVTIQATYTATPTTIQFITSDDTNKVETWTKQ